MKALNEIIEHYHLTPEAKGIILRLCAHKKALDTNDHKDWYAKARTYGRFSRTMINDGTYERLSSYGIPVPAADGTDPEQDTLPDLSSEDSNAFVLFVEPHPDDAILSYGGLLSQCVSRRKKQSIHLLLGVHGAHAVDDSFIDHISAEGRKALIRDYKNFTGAKASADDPAMLKAALRVAREHRAGLRRLCPKIPSITYAMLPSYDDETKTTYDDAERLNALLAPILQQGGNEQVAVVFDTSDDPHGRHRAVNRLVHRSLARVIPEINGIQKVMYLGAQGTWSMPDAAADRHPRFFVPLTPEMMHRKMEAFLAHTSQLLPMVSDYEPLSFHERMILKNAWYARVAESRGIFSTDDYPFAECMDVCIFSDIDALVTYEWQW